MKFAVITDIHGNAAALNSVLYEIDTKQDIEHIFCLGDMIAIGPDTNEVLEILFSRHDISMITGNHDEAILALLRGQAYPESHKHAKIHHQWATDRLNPSFLPKLEKLPRRICETFSGQTLLFTHYHIRKDKWNAPISHDPFSSIVSPSLTNLEDLFQDDPYDLICFGHHHPLHFFKGKKTVFLNPGSLGCSPKPVAPYGVVEIGEGILDIHLETASYDNREFLRSYEKLKVPEREFILKVFHGGAMAGCVKLENFDHLKEKKKLLKRNERL